MGASLAEDLRPDGVLLLQGSLGAGKTVLTQGIAAGLGLDPSQVQSPTFTLVREHHVAGQSLIHIDLYRLDPSEVETIGIWEILDSPGVKVVEWSERLPLAVHGAMEMSIERSSESEERVLTLSGDDGGAG